MAVQHDKVCSNPLRTGDGGHEISLRFSSCSQFTDPEKDAVNHQHSFDAYPMLLNDEASFQPTIKCPSGSSRLGQNVCCIPGDPKKGSVVRHSSSDVAFLNFIEDPYASDGQTCLDAQWNCSAYIDLEIESAGECSSSDMDVNLPNEYLEIPRTNEETAGHTMRNESHLQSALQWKGSLKTIHSLPDQSLMLLKCSSRDKNANEKGHDTTNYRWRRYKRSVSFDSRKIGLLFSILSIVGTMVLIYLTLRVRQNTDGSAPIY